MGFYVRVVAVSYNQPEPVYQGGVVISNLSHDVETDGVTGALRWN